MILRCSPRTTQITALRPYQIKNLNLSGLGRGWLGVLTTNQPSVEKTGPGLIHDVVILQRVCCTHVQRLCKSENLLRICHVAHSSKSQMREERLIDVFFWKSRQYIGSLYMINIVYNKRKQWQIQNTMVELIAQQRMKETNWETQSATYMFDVR